MRPLFFRSLPLIASLLLGPLHTMAQGGDMPPPPTPERLKEIKAQKSAFITTQLELTPEEAQRFWPIYNEYDDKNDVLRKEMRDLFSPSKASEAMTEAEAAALLEKSLQHRQKEIDLEKSYMERFKKSIGAVKTLQLRKAEHDFNREVLRKFRDRMEDRHGADDGRPPRRP
ncbi:MAG: sensor of ECF-type sigma factor [Flavobacteriales bacterium]|nr:sensor of ECF-type sigma factor [Flavobacteriales bacterium]